MLSSIFLCAQFFVSLELGKFFFDFALDLLGTKPPSHLDLGIVVEFALVSPAPQWHGAPLSGLTKSYNARGCGGTTTREMT